MSFGISVLDIAFGVRTHTPLAKMVEDLVATIWVTYAWADNKSGDVDFIAQELSRAGVTIKLDRWNLNAGTRLWEQIAEFISSPGQCDAWVLIATQASLGSQPCREEFAYALDRALNTRGESFPVIGLFPASVDNSLIPPAIRTRLYVSLQDPDWKERIKSAAEKRSPSIAHNLVEPYHLAIHSEPDGVVIEMRPRAGTWSPFVVVLPTTEHALINSRLSFGTAGRIPQMTALFGTGTGTKDQWTFHFAQNEATPTMSYYLHCSKAPSTLHFGIDGGTQYTVNFKQP